MHLIAIHTSPDEFRMISVKHNIIFNVCHNSFKCRKKWVLQKWYSNFMHYIRKSWVKLCTEIDDGCKIIAIVGLKQIWCVHLRHLKQIDPFTWVISYINENEAINFIFKVSWMYTYMYKEV